jgi:hypothetical protein
LEASAKAPVPTASVSLYDLNPVLSIRGGARFDPKLYEVSQSVVELKRTVGQCLYVEGAEVGPALLARFEQVEAQFESLCPNVRSAFKSGLQQAKDAAFKMAVRAWSRDRQDL